MYCSNKTLCVCVRVCACVHVCVCSVAQSCPALFHPCLREAKPESHFSVVTTGMRKPEERGRNDVLSPRFLIHLLQPSDIYAKFRPSRISGLWTSLSYAANGKMGKQSVVEEVLIQGKKNTNNCWAFSLASISMLSPCVSKTAAAQVRITKADSGWLLLSPKYSNSQFRWEPRWSPK